MPIGEPAREPALKILKEGLGLEPGIDRQAIVEFRPNILERILPSPPGSGGDQFTGQATDLPVTYQIRRLRELLELV